MAAFFKHLRKSPSLTHYWETEVYRVALVSAAGFKIREWIESGHMVQDAFVPWGHEEL